MSNTQIQKYKYKIHKYTNTAYDEVPKRPDMWYIFEKRNVQGYQFKLYTGPNVSRFGIFSSEGEMQEKEFHFKGR